MPKYDRPDYRRIELFFPLDLWAAIEAEAGMGNVTAWLCGLAAKRVGVAYEPEPRGRPRKATKPAAKKKPARKGKRGAK